MEQIVSAEKTCNKCGEMKSVAAFYKDRSRKDGLRTYCKSCNRARNKAYYETNRAKEAARNKAYLAQNRERRMAYHREYREANTDRRQAYMRAYDAKRRLATLDAIESLSPCPTDAEVISALSDVYTLDASPICKLADSLLALAQCGAEEHEAKAEIMAEVDAEWLTFQRGYQHATIKEYEDEYA